MKPVGIKDNVFWVGAIDWNERDFHNFLTRRGLTYNSYLIVDEKVTLVDTVKHKFVKESLDRIKKIVDPSQIDYIVMNHIEPDHSSGLPDMMRIAENATVVCSQRAKDGICKYYDCDGWNIKVVKGGDELKIGTRTLMFIDMTMLHWPDSMATYLKEDKLLFSNDAFGQHVASEERFDEELGVEETINWAKLYYANILMPLAGLIKKKLSEVQNLGLEIEMIAPSHGVIWKNPGKIIEAYSRWANFESENKVVVVFDTMWHSTERLAEAIAEGAGSEGAEVRVFHVRKDSWTDIVTEILDAKSVAIGAPTIHNGLFPPVAGFLTYLKGLKPQNKKALTFGSYGWNGNGVKEIQKVLEELKFETLEPLMVKFKPSEEELQRAFDLGAELAR
ncbi:MULTISPECIES: FprA family A-type flavoprotein [unclassified Archaeoglobus]|jgi:flavorubredoxin|uniref:FprA family A-type flavoprotein n=1 Tax=unclassified Archaeoglobus TaxID=2643606 RepID=UPI0025B86FA4|nr:MULTISPECIES: FprA family A-type flavoprotein [unclassified Archaeoglobus]